MRQLRQLRFLDTAKIRQCLKCLNYLTTKMIARGDSREKKTANSGQGEVRLGYD
jgi:hypothetical protein